MKFTGTVITLTVGVVTFTVDISKLHRYIQHCACNLLTSTVKVMTVPVKVLTMPVNFGQYLQLVLL